MVYSLSTDPSNSTTKLIQQFNQNKTRLRISVTNMCNFSCTFCHKEGHDGSNEIMELEKYKEILIAYKKIGGHELNITGGEPLLHPSIKEIVCVSNSIFNGKITLSTNASILDKINFDPDVHKISETKISLHFFNNNDTSNHILGAKFDASIIKENIAKHVSKGYNTTVNTVVMKNNIDYLPELIDWIVDIGANLKISDLGLTADNQLFYESEYIPLNSVEQLVKKYSFSRRMLTNRAGNNLILYELKNGTHILIKDINNGKLTTDMCFECPYFRYCSEGVFALRVLANGVYAPCLLRHDNRINAGNSEYEKMIKAIATMYGSRNDQKCSIDIPTYQL